MGQGCVSGRYPRQRVSQQPVRVQTPEEKELAKKRAELARLETELLERELELSTLQAELIHFQARYLKAVGSRLAALDKLRAEVAKAEVRLKPESDAARKRAAEARARAEESRQAVEGAGRAARAEKFTPSDDLKKLYRELAKRIHPDLAEGEKERARRSNLMAEVNAAYARGDENRLGEILQTWETRPEAVKGEGPAAELVRIIRKIANVEARIRTLKAQLRQLTDSDLSRLRAQVAKAGNSGRNLLAEMAKTIDREIAQEQAHLSSLVRGRSAS